MLTSADEVTLTEASLPAAVFLTKIVATCAELDTSVEQLVALSEMGADAGVIAAMLATGSRSDEHGPQGRHHPRGNPIGPTAGRAGHRLCPDFRLLARRKRTADRNTPDLERPDR